MAKTNATFKLGKMVKLTLATILDKTERRIYLKAMVSAQQSYLESKNKKFTELRSTTPANGTPARQPQPTK
jgi:hypothetical protein